MESFPVKQNTVVSPPSSQSPPPPISRATIPHHQPPLSPATDPAPCVFPPHECIFSCGHCPTVTTLSLVTPHQSPPSAATVPPAATATSHHELSIVLALTADTLYHEQSSSAIAPTPAVSNPQPAPPSSTSTDSALSLVTPHQPPSSAATAPSAAAATPHHESLSTVLALPEDTPCHEPSSSGIAPVLHNYSTPQPALSSSDIAAALCLPVPDYKSRLNMFVQKTNISFPKFQTVIEGLEHAPRFRSTVWVDNTCFTSQTTFSHRKAAEQDVSRVALEGLHARYAEQDASRTRDNGNLLLLEDTPNSKSILNEYALKLKLGMPDYNTRNIEGLLHLFVSSVFFNGTNYSGDAARNKKDAEQLAARTAIISILGDSKSGTLFEIVKSKSKVFAAVQPDTSQCVKASTVPDLANTRDTYLSLDCRDKEVVLPVPSIMSSSSQDFQMPGHEPSVEVTMPLNLCRQPDPEHFTEDGSRSKKRRKNEEARLEPRGKEIVLPEPSNMSSSSQDFWMPRREPSVEVTMPPNLCLQPDPEHSIEDDSRSKKRRENEEDRLEPQYQFFEFL